MNRNISWRSDISCISCTSIQWDACSLLPRSHYFYVKYPLHNSKTHLFSEFC